MMTMNNRIHNRISINLLLLLLIIVSFSSFQESDGFLTTPDISSTVVVAKRREEESMMTMMMISTTKENTNSETIILDTTTNSNNKQKDDDSSILLRTPRAIEIASILTSKIISPLILSLLREGWPEDWNTFWSHNSFGTTTDNNIRGGTNGDRIALAAEELGPTYVKFCQALASRPDVIPPSLAKSLESLQDNMIPTFDYDTAQCIIRTELKDILEEKELEDFVTSLEVDPIGSASIGQVYKGYVLDEPVAIKIKRRGIKELVRRDAELVRGIAVWLESIPKFGKNNNNNNNRFIATELVDAVEEFFSRIYEEMDYRNEAQNCIDFGKLYGSEDIIVPKIMLQTENIIVMEWLDGTKLTDVYNNNNDDTSSLRQENLNVVMAGIECTLNQLLVTGRLHADPHAGNLLKIVSSDEEPKLAYLDFGMVSTVPRQVRDALICAVSYLIFARDVDAVASLFGELQLLPEDVLNDPIQRTQLIIDLETTLDQALVYDSDIPKLKFDKLLNALTLLVPKFQFKLPPYFINNARALSTLEGIAVSLDPNFNVFTIMYPIALNRLLTNPTQSKIIDKTIQNLIRDMDGRIDEKKVTKLLNDSASLTGYSNRKVLYDILKTKGGRKFAFQIMKEKIVVRRKKEKNRSISNFLRL